MKIIALSGSQVTLELAGADSVGMVFNDILNEVCNGFHLADFPRAIGVERPVACALLERVHNAITRQQDPRATHQYFFTLIENGNTIGSTTFTFTNTELTILRNAAKETYRELAVNLDELQTRVCIGGAKFLALQAVLTTLLETMSQLAMQQEAGFCLSDLKDLRFTPLLQSIEIYEQTPSLNKPKYADIDPRKQGGVLSQEQYEWLMTTKPGTVVKGTVSKIRDSGIFVALNGFYRWIPKSELDPDDLLHVGQEVEVTVVSVDTEKAFLTFSLKREP